MATTRMRSASTLRAAQHTSAAPSTSATKGLNDSMAHSGAAAASGAGAADPTSKFATTAGETMSGTGWASLATLVLGLSKHVSGRKLNTKIHAIITDGENVICLKPRHPRAVVWTTDYKPRVAGYPSIEPIGIMDGLNFFVMGRDTNKPREQSRFITLAGGTVEKVVGKPHDLKLADSAADDPVWDQLKRELREELGPTADALLSKSDVCTDWVAFNSGTADAKLDTCITAVLREEVWSRVRSGLTMEFGRLVDEPATAEGAGAAARGTGSLTAFEQDMCQQWMAFNDCRTGRGGASIVNVCITAVLRVGVSLAPGSATRTKLLRHRLAHDEVRHMLLAREWSSADFDFLTETLKNLSFQDEVAELLFPTLEELAGVRHRREAAAGFPKLCIEYRDERDRIPWLSEQLLMGERSTAAARSCCAAALETATAGMLAAGE
ncbi:hypothetical protein FNF29_08429 [Cafeteria roenbergensis]|uniref:Uncharacterized protein n=1 Tax=Cafeteria roenbergensis TaxID=33653 RepID=A0A5A8C1D6_CAFRO|nr:hypothetical protein FNF29_08429 [Cafeteria roenbergensis]|eukprot:KAA0145691.1 hypothetical protein FNF29_08429 [Cafeteria roenbergensis]